MLLGLGRLFAELARSAGFLFLNRSFFKAWVHLGVLVGFTFNRHAQQVLYREFLGGVEEVQMPGRMAGFLRRGFLKERGDFFVAELARDLGEVEVLLVGHRLARKGGFEVLPGFDFGFFVVRVVAHTEVSFLESDCI